MTHRSLSTGNCFEPPKDQITKARSLGIKYVSFPGINFYSFFFAKLYWHATRCPNGFRPPVQMRGANFEANLNRPLRHLTPTPVKFAVLMKRVQIEHGSRQHSMCGQSIFRLCSMHLRNTFLPALSGNLSKQESSV